MLTIESLCLEFGGVVAIDDHALSSPCRRTRIRGLGRRGWDVGGIGIGI